MLSRTQQIYLTMAEGLRSRIYFMHTWARRGPEKQNKDPSCSQKKTFFNMSSVQCAVFLHDLAWERSAKHSMSFLAEFKSSPHHLIFTSVETEDQPWWSQCFSICSFVDLGGFSRTLLRDNPAWGFPPALRKGAEVTFSAASSLLPCNSQGERDICADLVEEKS